MEKFHSLILRLFKLKKKQLYIKLTVVNQSVSKKTGWLIKQHLKQVLKRLNLFKNYQEKLNKHAKII